jgi:hypothetical protein
MGKKAKKEIRRQQEASADLLAASKPVSGREDAAEEIVADKERSQGGEREKQLHGESTKDANSTGYIPPLPDQPRFPRPGSLSTDADGLIGQPAERNAPTPPTEAIDTGGESLEPSPSQPAAAAWAGEMTNARARGSQVMAEVQPRPQQDWSGFQRPPTNAKAHREAASGQYDEVPGGHALGPDEVTTFDLSQAGHADALRGRTPPPQPNGQPPLPGETSVVAPVVKVLDQSEIRGAAL